ncbi:SIR2 family protein [Leptospira sp. WS4.C2]
MNKISNYTDSDSEIVVLLGAGASIDAGIPGVFGLTQELYTNFTQLLPHKEYAHMFAYVVSGIQQNKTTTGRSPFEPPNVEEVISAIQLIATRQKLEADPFIASWDQKIQYFERSRATDSSDLSRSLSSAFKNIFNQVESAFSETLESVEKLIEGDTFAKSFFTKGRISNILSRSTYDLDNSIRDIEASLHKILTVRDKPVDNWKILYQYTHALLADIMWLNDYTRCDYLNPLLNLSSKRTHIVTLNYDTSIELLAKNQSIEISDGFDTNNIYKSEFNSSMRIHYLKLHGSINWLWDFRRNATVKLELKPKENYMPSLIIGQREKLRSQGPFLDLLFEFRNKLKNVKQLISIGYSFSDEHINKYIQEWLEISTNNLVIVSGSNFNNPEFMRDKPNILNTKLTIKEFLK